MLVACLDQVDRNVERELVNLRMLNHPNIIGFKEVCHQSACYGGMLPWHLATLRTALSATLEAAHAAAPHPQSPTRTHARPTLHSYSS